jgi:GDP-4-dehydro-6-deoxy-D-mannose reductase
VPGLPLVTGGTGFAGSHLVDHLLEEETAVAAWSHRGSRNAAPEQRAVRWSAVDLLDREAVAQAVAELAPSVIYHCAGIAHVGDSWTEPARALQVNVIGTHHVLEAVRRAGLDSPVLVTGSALVYRPSAEPITEDDPTGPSDPYGVSKLAQEMLAMRTTYAPVFLVRPFNHAGPRQSDAYVTSSFARQIAEIEAGQREPVLRVGNLETYRDITDVRDTVRAYRLVVRHGRPVRPYNVCSGRAYRVRDLLETLVGMSSAPIQIELDPARLRPSDNPIIAGNRARIGAEAQWEPRIPIERTLADLLSDWREKTRTATNR